jgi:hypothetical protein
MTDRSAWAGREGKALEGLRALDRALETRGAVGSLGPGRPRATALATLVTRLAAADSATLREAAAVGVERIVRAMLNAFPDNLLWDLDYLVVRLLAHARDAGHPASALARHADAIVSLQDQFGEATAISFRYVHDFLYGYDWARWVARKPGERSSVGPFDPPFIEVMRRRGEALLEAIDRDSDPKYPPLRDERHRNPFGFSRAPGDELILHRHLARRALIPVEAWRVDATPRWTKDFTALRRREAFGLGLGDPDLRDETDP